MTVVIPEGWSVLTGEERERAMLRVLHEEVDDGSLVLTIERIDQLACSIQGRLPAPTSEDAADELKKVGESCGWLAAQLLILLSRISDLDCTVFSMQSDGPWLQLRVASDREWLEIKEEIRQSLKQAFKVDKVDFSVPADLELLA